MALAAWAAARAPAFALEAQRRDADGPLVDRALEVVRAFIAERRLILFGGLAIDLALRSRGGEGIYPPGQRPDFDFLSPRSVDDAYDLAERLQKAGFPGVAAIRGIHVQTMRVRTDFVYVADVGYAPPAVFEALPFLELEGLRVLHPDFQRLDMHLAFCFPFNGPPREDVFHRWGKDLARLRLLSAAFPVAGAAPPPPWPRASCRPPSPVAAGAGALAAAPAPAALHGFAAYAVLRRALDALAAALGRPPPASPPRLELAFEGDRVSVECPAGPPALVLASPEPGAFLAGAPGFVRRAPYLDVSPEAFVGADGALEVHSSRGRLLAASVADVGGGLFAFVVSPQYLLLWLLFRAARAGPGADREAFRAFYAFTLEALAEAGRLFAGALAGADAEARGALLDAFAASPFAPTVRTIGRVNTDAAYAIRVASAASRARDTPPAVLGVETAGLLSGLPSGFFPPGPRPPFDYGASPLFRRDGEPAGQLYS